jgi:hypothetical protein
MDMNEDSIHSMGGKARAQAMSPEQRSESARNAALAKWEKSPTAKKTPRATHAGDLKIGNLVIPCAVLDNGQRVISDRSLAETLGIRGGGAYYQRKKKGETGAMLPEYISAKYLQGFIGEEIRARVLDSITYKSKSGQTANGIEAVILPQICDIWLRYKESGAFNPEHAPIVEKAYLLIRSFATVGIIALVDEATGYQDVRDRQALQEILKKYIDGELYKWTETFPLALYKEIFRLKGWPWNNGRMPQVVGHYTNDLVYDRLTKGMLEELKRLNPKDEATGRRKHRNYQFFTPEVGYPALNKRLNQLVGMAMGAETWDQFHRLVDRRFPRMTDTPRLPFVEDV